MSVIKPQIDDLLEKTENNRFLLASLASKRACDINNMVRGQHSRVLADRPFGPGFHLDGHGGDHRRRHLF